MVPAPNAPPLGLRAGFLVADRRNELRLLKRWRRAEGCCVVYYCGSLVFLLILLKTVLKQETIALDVKAEASMKCENIDTDEPLTSKSGHAPQSTSIPRVYGRKRSERGTRLFL